MTERKAAAMRRRRRLANPAGVWLAEMRAAKGYSLEEWARALDYNKSTLCRFETTGPVPVVVTLAALAIPAKEGTPAGDRVRADRAASKALASSRKSQAARKGARRRRPPARAVAAAAGE